MSNRAFLGHPVYIYRMSQNHRIAENLQNCNMKIHNFQFWSILYEKIVFHLFTRFQLNNVYLIL